MSSPAPNSPHPAGPPSPSLWRVGLAAAFLGLMLSSVYYYWTSQSANQRQELHTPEQTEAELALPEGGIRTDAFSLKLLHAALEEQTGNVTVAPSALTEAILSLQAVDGNSIDETCQKFGLQDKEPSAATLPNHFLQIFVDESQALGAENRSLMTIPIKRDPVLASAFINRLALPQQHQADLMLKASDVCPEDQFITAIDQKFAPSWLHPIGPQHMAMLPFTTAFGMPESPTMQVADLYRVVQAPDDTWEAVALFFKKETGTQNDDWVSLVIVHPKVGTARRLAEKLTVEQISDIRKALVETPARPYNLQIPPLQVRATCSNALPLLLKMGLNPLPLSREGNNKGTQARGSIYLQYSISIGASPEDESKSATAAVEGYPLLPINSSYLWWIGSLTSPAPFLYMGVVEHP